MVMGKSQNLIEPTRYLDSFSLGWRAKNRKIYGSNNRSLARTAPEPLKWVFCSIAPWPPSHAASIT